MNCETLKVVKVRLRSGDVQWVLVHLEIQSGPEPGFERRIAKFNSGLFWAFDQRVVTVVVLADLQRDCRPPKLVLPWNT